MRFILFLLIFSAAIASRAQIKIITNEGKKYKNATVWKFNDRGFTFKQNGSLHDAYYNNIKRIESSFAVLKFKDGKLDVVFSHAAIVAFDKHLHTTQDWILIAEGRIEGQLWEDEPLKSKTASTPKTNRMMRNQPAGSWGAKKTLQPEASPTDENLKGFRHKTFITLTPTDFAAEEMPVVAGVLFERSNGWAYHFDAGISGAASGEGYIFKAGIRKYNKNSIIKLPRKGDQGIDSPKARLERNFWELEYRHSNANLYSQRLVSNGFRIKHGTNVQRKGGFMYESFIGFGVKFKEYTRNHRSDSYGYGSSSRVMPNAVVGFTFGGGFKPKA